MPRNDDSQAWPQGWDGHAAAQRARWATLSLAERIDWLEQAQRLASDMGHGAGTGQPPRRAKESQP
ncbi:MAG: hypothetical protein FJW23_11070 [Acidimicrobiia bacterium]|nr:hypothetical protein [Acidimicrobiia bacterium]